MKGKSWTLALLVLAAVLLLGRRAGAGTGNGGGGVGDGGLYPVDFGSAEPFPIVQQPAFGPGAGPAPVQDPLAYGQPVAVVGVIPATNGAGGGFVTAPGSQVGGAVIAYSPVPGTTEPVERELAFAGASRHRVGNIAQAEIF